MKLGPGRKTTNRRLTVERAGEALWNKNFIDTGQSEQKVESACKRGLRAVLDGWNPSTERGSIPRTYGQLNSLLMMYSGYTRDPRIAEHLLHLVLLDWVRSHTPPKPAGLGSSARSLPAWNKAIKRQGAYKDRIIKRIKQRMPYVRMVVPIWSLGAQTNNAVARQAWGWQQDRQNQLLRAGAARMRTSQLPPNLQRIILRQAK